MYQIMEQFSIDASHFGVLAAFYYYGYAGMQIPVAILLDRFGARNIILIFAMLCGIATLIFTHTNNFYLAVLSRFLVGAGSAVGFLGVSKVISEWFPKKNYSKMIGFSFTLGLMGAIYGGKPISLLIENYQWQNVALILGLLSISIGLTTWFFLRSPENIKVSAANEPMKITDLKFILMSPWIWCLAIANLLMVGSLEGLADIWGVPYLMTAYSIGKGEAAGLISFIFFGMLFGGPLLAFFSKKFGNYIMIIICGFGMTLILLLLLFGNIYNMSMLSFLFFITGMLCCYQVIIFAAGAELVAEKNLGITIAFLNSINMLGGSFFHTLIGKVMDIFWSGSLSKEGIKLYHLDAYQYALGIIPLCSCVGALIIFILKFKLKNNGMTLKNM